MTVWLARVLAALMVVGTVGVPIVLGRPIYRGPGSADVVLSCGGSGQVFRPAVLTGPTGAELADTAAATALRAYLARTRGSTAGEGPGWRLLTHSPDGAMFGEQWPSYLHVLSVERAVSGRWAVTGGGECWPLVHRAGLENARWAIDPSTPIGPTTRTFAALVSELRCTGGDQADGRVVPPTVVYTDTTVVVTFFVRPLAAELATCPGATPTRYEVDLVEPVGDRKLLDGALYPASPPGRGPYLP